MMTKELETEAAIWAEGTAFARDELLRLYAEHVAEFGEDDCSSFIKFCEHFLGIRNVESDNESEDE